MLTGARPDLDKRAVATGEPSPLVCPARAACPQSLRQGRHAVTSHPEDRAGTAGYLGAYSLRALRGLGPCAFDANARAAKASKKTPPSAEGASTQRTSPLRGYRRVNYSTGAT